MNNDADTVQDEHVPGEAEQVALVSHGCATTCITRWDAVQVGVWCYCGAHAIVFVREFDHADNALDRRVQVGV